jgi:hypothetical protein
MRWSTNGEMRMHTKPLSERLKKRDHLAHVSADKRIILKWILK